MPVSVGFILVITPTIISDQTAVIDNLIYHVFIREEIFDSQDIVFKLYNNLKINGLSIYHTDTTKYYISDSLINIIAMIFFSIGLLLCTLKIKNYNNRLLLSWLIISFILTGLFAPYHNTVYSRLYLLLLPISIISGIGFYFIYAIYAKWVNRFIYNIFIQSTVKNLLIVILIMLVSTFSAHQFYTVTHMKYNYTAEALATRVFRSEHCNSSSDKSLFIAKTDHIKLVLNSYGYNNINVDKQLKEINKYRCIIFLDNNNDKIEQILNRYSNASLHMFTNNVDLNVIRYIIME